MTKIYLKNDPTTTDRIRHLNDEARKVLASNIAYVAQKAHNQLVITHGVGARGWDFIARALAAVRDFADFTPENDPHGEHDFAIFEIDGMQLNWKIDYYDRTLKYGSEDPSDPEKTRRVLTIMLAEEY
jgi:predicted esterase